MDLLKGFDTINHELCHTEKCDLLTSGKKNECKWAKLDKI